MSEQAFNFSGEAKLGAAKNPTGKSLEQLMEENLLLTQEIYKLAAKTKRYMLMGQIMGAIKLVLILGPLIVAILFLPPYLKQAFSTYNELLGSGSGKTLMNGNDAVRELLKGDINETIKNYTQPNGINLKSR